MKLKNACELYEEALKASVYAGTSQRRVSAKVLMDAAIASLEEALAEIKSVHGIQSEQCIEGEHPPTRQCDCGQCEAEFCGRPCDAFDHLSSDIPKGLHIDLKTVRDLVDKESPQDCEPAKQHRYSGRFGE